METKITAIAELLGQQDHVSDNVMLVARPNFVFTLCDEGAMLKAELLFKKPCPQQLMGKAALRLAQENQSVLMNGFFMDAYGNYGQRHFFSRKEENENIAYSCYLMIGDARRFTIYSE